MVQSQQTLKQPVAFSGIGLHSGNRVNMSLLPAPAGTGLRFRRVDLEGRPEIEASADLVGDTQRSTSIGKGPVKLHTVEHVLAALAGAGVTNAYIELDANEPPIADGSSREFAGMIREAGVLKQAESLEPFRVTTPIEFTHGETSMIVLPHNGFKITCTSADKAGRFTQFHSTEVTPATWGKELSHARTFCFYEEIEFLIKNGLIRGGSLENAIVIRDDAVLTNEPLRYPEEFVRHKMLDIVGDLALVGRPLHGHVIAVKPSHFANTELAKLILAQIRKPIEQAQTFGPPPAPAAEKNAAKSENRSAKAEAKAVSAPASSAAPAHTPAPGAPVLDIMQVMEVIPHRPPFLMVDKISLIEGNRIVGQKNVTMDEPFFAGHFPGHPVMPGVLQLEAIAQVAGILMLRVLESTGKIAYFMSAEDVKWRKPVRPGDVLLIDVTLTKMRGKIGRAKGTCLVDGEVVSEAEVTFMLMDR
jgi:UDP-3-O-[3-hydroxymyristoyl] N-acetylglucosamine deacetylase/3-hydroxyacyl-[acyl-carrier-protein] dehydratase